MFLQHIVIGGIDIVMIDIGSGGATFTVHWFLQQTFDVAIYGER